MKKGIFKKDVNKRIIAGTLAAASCFSTLTCLGDSTALSSFFETKPIVASAADISVLIVADAEDNGNKIIQPGKWNVSPSGEYALVFQNDGNLVVYHHDSAQNKLHSPVWSSGTSGNSGAKCILQGDGNLVIYTSDMKPIWSTATNGKQRAYLGLADDGELYVYSRDTGCDTWSNYYHNGFVSPSPVISAGIAVAGAEEYNNQIQNNFSNAAQKLADNTKEIMKTISYSDAIRIDKADDYYKYGKVNYKNNTYAISPQLLNTKDWNLEYTKDYSTSGLNIWNAASYELTGSLLCDIINIFYNSAESYRITAKFYVNKKGTERKVVLEGSDSYMDRYLQENAGRYYFYTLKGKDCVRVISTKHLTRSAQWLLWINKNGEGKMTFAEIPEDVNKLSNSNTSILYKIDLSNCTSNVSTSNEFRFLPDITKPAERHEVIDVAPDCSKFITMTMGDGYKQILKKITGYSAK